MDIPFARPDQFGPELMLYLGVFIGVIIMLEGLRRLLAGEEKRIAARSRRLKRIRAHATPVEVLALLRSRPATGLLPRIPVIGRLTHSLQQAGIEANTRLVMLGFLACAILASLVASAFFGPALGVLLGAIGTYLALVVTIGTLRRRRIEKLEKQLPDAIELMVRGLRVGHPLATSVRNVALNMPDPIATEFEHIADQISFGDEVPAAFADLAERTEQEDFRYLAAAVSIQSGTGGNLARVLTTLAKVIRDRGTLRRKILAISSEGRLSMKILTAVPFLIYGFVSVTSPSFYGDVSDDPLFMPAMIGIAVLLALNFLVLRKLVNFKF